MRSDTLHFKGLTKMPREETTDDRLELEDLLACRITISMPDTYFLGRVSRAHPELEFEITSLLPLEDRDQILNVKVRGKFDRQTLQDEMGQVGEVSQIEVSEVTSETTTYSVRVPIDAIARAHQEAQVVQHYPVEIRAGMATLDEVAPARRIRELWARLREEHPNIVLMSVRSRDSRSAASLLTEHQIRVFEHALMAGYWDTPRRVTLTEMAEEMNVAKSTMHETLRLVESRLIHEANTTHRRK